jgi:gluconokinase
MAHDGSPLMVVVMGVAGAGKTLVGVQLAARLKVDYADADSFHSPANVGKMAAGTPLDDQDRWPWLAEVGRWLRTRRSVGAVASCSALRRAYRDALREAVPELTFLHLHGAPTLIAERASRRTNHFMPASLVTSQLATLEPLAEDERGVVLDVSASPMQIIDEFLTRV